jgi:hypothetical protein
MAKGEAPAGGGAAGAALVGARCGAGAGGRGADGLAEGLPMLNGAAEDPPEPGEAGAGPCWIGKGWAGAGAGAPGPMLNGET